MQSPSAPDYRFSDRIPGRVLMPFSLWAFNQFRDQHIGLCRSVRAAFLIRVAAVERYPFLCAESVERNLILAEALEMQVIKISCHGDGRSRELSFAPGR